MSRENTAFTLLVRQALEDRGRRGIADRADLWPYVKQRTALRRSGEYGKEEAIGFTRRVVLAAVLCLIVSLGGFSIAAAASPSVRTLLHDTFPFIPSGQSAAVMNVDGEPIQLQPVPPFRVFYPSSIPSELYVFGTGQLLGTGQDATDSISGGATCPPDVHRCPDLRNLHLLTLFVPPDGSSGLPALLTPFQGHGVRAVWFGRHAVPPDNRFIQIVEWNATGSSTTTDDTSFDPHPSQVQGAQVTTMTKGGTKIRIETNLSESITQRIVDSLTLTAVGRQ